MRLKRLALFGFKSFADRTEFDFADNTLTGVVGPNGCGKSNVVDAIRWVLGEQRPTSMRGAEMIDVIFKGSSTRPGLSVAEATLILDNAGGVLAGRGAEVGITRRVFKDGQGEYLLDGERVRLKDVRELLFDTGLGSRGYSVLEQGRIDAVLSANPLERRRIFEEAAGVSRYRQRRHETDLRLKRVEQDLERLDDVLGELATRVRSLKIQAGKAERFVESRARWSSERTRLLAHRLAFHDQALGLLRERLGALEAQAEELRGVRSACEGDAAASEREGQSLASEVERLSQDASRLEGDGRALDERRAQLAERVLAWKRTADEEARRAEDLAQKLRSREGEIESLSADVARLSEELGLARAALAERASASSELLARHGACEGGCAEQNERVLVLLQQRTEAENQIRILEGARAPADERQRRTAERSDAAEQAVRAVAADEERAAAAVARAEETLVREDGLRRERASELEILERRAAEIETERTRLELERERGRARIEFLLDRERDLEALDAGSRDALSKLASAGEDLPVAASAIHGLVADRLSTATEFARALDAVLGERSRAIVAEGKDAALAIGRWLVVSSEGQVGVAVRSGLARREGLAGQVPDGDPSVLGPLADRVRTSEGCEALRDLLCGDVVLVRDLDAAVRLVADHPSVRFVTLAGELVDAAGLVGGGRVLAGGAIGRRSSAADLGDEVRELTGAVEDAGRRLSELAAARSALAHADERGAQELEIARAALARAREDLASARARRADLDAAARALDQERRAHALEAERLEAELTRARELVTDVGLRFETESTRLAELERELGALAEEREALARASSQAEVERTRVATEHAGLERRLADLGRARDESRGELERARRLSAEQAESARAGAAEAEELAAESAAITARRGDLKERLAEARSQAERSRERSFSVRRRSEDVTRELEATQEAVGGSRLETQRLELLRQDVLLRAGEELGLSELDLGRDFAPEEGLRDEAALDALERAVRDLRAELDRLGPVNLEAVAELSEVGARHEFLVCQRADLAQARASLAEAVRTIDEESKRLFLETFEQVRGNFQRVFRQLFGGGRADVTLEEGVDVLDAGVEIVARPPGRELLSIGLLSGGQRTLTALALLFAVFEARPSPFCVLDEVDAALDDANIERFLAMLAGYRKSTQFIVVTHNKGTMAACESLYGVTMETKGVSRQVSVELEDVDEWARSAPEAAAEPVAASAASGNGHGGGEPLGRESGESLGRESGEPLDRESGEPVVEIVPLRAARAPRDETDSAWAELDPAESFDRGGDAGLSS